MNDIKELQSEVKRLTLLLKSNTVVAKPSTNDEPLKKEISELKVKLQSEKNNYAALIKIVQQRNTSLNKAVKALSEIPDIDIPERSAIIEKPIRNPQVTHKPYTYGVVKSPVNGSSNGAVTGGAMRMLKAAAMFYPENITKTRMAALARLSHTSGSFSTYMSTLKREGLLTGDGNAYSITQAGLAKAGDVEPLPTDPEELINLWCGVIGENGGAARMLRALAGAYPEAMTKEELGEAVSMSHTSGSFSTYLSTLKRNALITTTPQTVKASDELFV